MMLSRDNRELGDVGFGWFVFCSCVGLIITCISLLAKALGVDLVGPFSWGELFWPLGMGVGLGLSPLVMFIMFHVHD